MSQPVLVKVYGYVRPASEALHAELDALCARAIADVSAGQAVTREDDMLLLCFEGQYFPVEEALEIFAHLLGREHDGKLDVLDTENWRLTRHVFADGAIRTHSASLNSVLDHSSF
ncbi:MAG: hypothetical protein LBR31_03165 [Desulfovibrio sp.]|nr:hypothetical protein [Desulfovibrio sp.]